ncbi:hypothetical protein QZH41_004895 [Actinostola sp. cb2023]|nr:hypothetical protein QZH41_004895 [Actinostola sp. cb2023]
MSLHASDTQETQAATNEKRHRPLSRKALQNAIETKRRELDVNAKVLQELYVIANTAVQNGECSEGKLQSLQTATQKYRNTLNELTELYQQDQWGDYEEEAKLTTEYSKLERAGNVIKQATDGCHHEVSSQVSRKSRRSSTSRASTSSSSARRNALADIAAARKQAEYDKLIAEKDNARKVQQAQYELEMAKLAADKAEAIASARLLAIEECLDEEEFKDLDLPADPDPEDHEGHVNTWVQNHPITNTITPGQEPAHRPIVTSTPKRDSTIGLLETFTITNQRLVSGLTRQSLPKCHPDIFDGEVTLFHPWKRAFRAMIDDADVTPAQEMNYLRNFTKGEVQNVVDNFRKRHHTDLAVVLRELWRELERRFGNTAAITNVLLERLTQAANFSEKNLPGLQAFADLCGDIDSQLAFLPGLSCLNYPNVLRPIVERLPNFLRSKWEKDIISYATKHQDAYPGFHVFASMAQEQANKKNHPNVQASGVQPTVHEEQSSKRTTKQEFASARRVMKTNTEENNKPHCKFHDCDGHELTECKAFAAKSIQEKTDWILKEKLCFRCLEAGHIAKECESQVTCSECNSDRHPTLLHKEKDGEELKSNCTSVCKKGGVSCSKILLVDVFHHQRPQERHRVYAIIDDQSNTSMITPDLADKLKADGPRDRYLLSTCSGEREVNYGRRVSGVLLSAGNKTSKLPTLVECAHLPQDKAEIPTPEIAGRFSHLRDIAQDIPPLDDQAKIHLLIGRDAPELLKVRAFKNGPRGAPWAQKLVLGWTISGQACLDFANGPVHIQARRTTVMGDNDSYARTDTLAEMPPGVTDSNEYDIVPCPNKFIVTDSLADCYTNDLKNDVFHSLPSDNESSLSCEDRKFLKVMEAGIHKNNIGNWEMPLPFRQEEVRLPNNRNQAVNRLNSLLRTLRKKPQMERDYIEFMEKVFNKGHASPIPPDELHTPEGRVWYIPHFGVYHPKKPTQIRVVFDSSAESKGVSLNKELLPGPDLMNSLVGVLMRFRKEEVAVMCDIEQMFYSFHVNPSHRDFLRFLWFEANDPKKPVIEYRMNVHLFGNGPSPAVATFGLRKTAADGEEEFGTEVTKFVHRNFYVDDGLTSLPTAQQAIDLVSGAQAALATSNLRLHNETVYTERSPFRSQLHIRSPWPGGTGYARR